MKDKPMKLPWSERKSFKLDLNIREATLLREMVGVAQYDCKQEVLGTLERIFDKLNRKLVQHHIEP
jgi:hypothetical protein